jgi:hypothetical protein
MADFLCDWDKLRLGAQKMVYRCAAWTLNRKKGVAKYIDQ